MIVQDLMDELSGFEPDAEVRLAQQPRWAFEYEISNVAQAVNPLLVQLQEELDEIMDADDGSDPDIAEMLAEKQAQIDAVESIPTPGVVYIAEGNQIGYHPTGARHALVW